MNSTLRILLLEGSDADAQRVMDMLRQGGLNAQFQHRANGVGVESLLEHEKWDIILCNVHLADISARYVLAFVRDLKLNTPVIVLSDGIGEEQAVSLMHAGAHDFISKSNLSRLLPAIERELEESTIRHQHQLAVAALHESERNFRQLMEHIGGVFWLMDALSGDAIYISPAFIDVWEYPIDAMKDGREFFLDTIHPEDFFRIERLLDSHGWLGLNAEYRIMLPDGGTRWINTRSFPIRDGQGTAYRVASFSLDVSERHHLAEEREMLTWALQQSADAVMITDTSGVILYVNAAFEAITGYSGDEVIGKKPAILKSGFHEPKFYETVWKNLSAGLPYTDVFINRRKDGELYYEAKTITPVSSANGEMTHYVSTGKDITERLKTRQQIHKLAHFDAVTGLANRNLLLERLEQTIIHARCQNMNFSVMSVGLDLSELLGEIRQKSLAEHLLRLIAKRLTDSLKPSATVARLENDEFVVLIQDNNSSESLEDAARTLMAAFTKPVCANGYELFLTPYIGISLYPSDGEDSETLLRHAEQAMQQARDHGHAAYAFYQNRKLPGARFLSS
jgi:PAS domain S-box-containing protein/diguanylate cyclase (GGDEF)-like protein